ncbi:MAG: ADP-ribosylation factor-like protein, partial [Candidatus Hodarchaeales archaeon]
SRKFLDFLEHNFLIMDFGGQQTYRKQHVAAKKKWKNVSALIFVVDIQDPAAFKPAKKYLAKLLKVISKTNERNPRLSIFLHKHDPAMQESLSENVSECLSCLEEYSEIANYHLTTIEDSSSNIAMIKSLYFSLPSVMIRRLLEEEFLNHFEEVILPQFSMLGRDLKLLEELKSDIHKSAVILGMTYSASLQESWLNYLMGEGIPRKRALSHKSLKVTQKGQSIYVRIPRWPEEEIPSELTTLLLEGMLKGMLKTFHLEAPVQIDESEAFSTWKLQL